MSLPVTVAVDAVGGDFSPKNVIDGVNLALEADPTITVALVGPRDVVGPAAEKNPTRITPIFAEEVITMDDHPAQAVRAKKDSSIVVGCRLVKDGGAGGFFSAGSTGAIMAAATLIIGRIKGISRPGLATVLPSRFPTVLLDIGANADVKPVNLVQFGSMGRAYVNAMFDEINPSVGLLNIGEEETKGSVLAQEAFQEMKVLPGFVGNVEGRDVLTGKVNVIVTDGFTGNVTLKLLEGTASTLFGEVKAALTSSPLKKLFALMFASSLRAIKDDLNPDRYGGAPLLGVKGVCLIGHGSSSPEAIKNGVLMAAKSIRKRLPELIESELASVDAASKTITENSSQHDVVEA